MSEKRPIGKILLEQKKLDQQDLGQALEHQQLKGGKLASNLLDMGVVNEPDLLRALSEQLGIPAVDLSQSIIPLNILDVIPEKVARDANILPIALDQDHISLAMANPTDKLTIDEINFVTGRKVEPYVAVEARLRQIISQAYSLRSRDKSILYYKGETATWPQGEEHPNGHLALISHTLPDPGVAITPDEELITIEVSADDEIPSDSPAVDQSGALILVVDDEEDIVRLLQNSLIANGYRVQTASRGLEALQAVKAYGPDLILLDAMLPEIHGFEICKKVKTSKRFGHIPVIMISAVYRGWRYAMDAKEAYGADDYVEKPFRLVPLLRKVDELLQGDRRRPETSEQTAALSYQKGVSLYREKRYDEALTSLKEACQLDPFSANIHYALANVLLAKNQIYEAMQEYEQTIELKPELFAPLRNLAILYQKKGFKNKAVEMWERALRCSPEGERDQVKAQLLRLL